MSLPPPGSAVVDAYEDTVVTPKSLKPRRQVKPFSCFRCCAILAIILCVTVGSLTMFLLLRTTTTLVRYFRSPLGRDLYAAPGANRSTVQPLIDTDTRFDVAVTVWARRANADTAHPEMYADDWEDEIEITEAQRFLYSRIGMPLVELSHLPEEDIVFSQIVIEDSSLNDKDRDVDVNFELPLARFEDEWIYPNDVRVTVVINPRSPSVLDHVTNFTSVKPTIMQWPPLAWGEDGSVHRAVVENMAVSIPLVKFVDQYDIIFDDFDDPDPRNEYLYPNVPIGADERLRHHPYLVNRAHVYFVNETRHLDREMWETKFKMWSEQGWERDKSLVNGTRFVGHNSSYEVAGHWEAGYELAGDVDKEGNRPLAYSPYIGVMQHGAGPLHRVRLPITRPFMADMEDGSELPEVQHGPSSINMTLSLRVSVLNPYRERLFHLKDHVTNAMSPAHNQTELELKQAHYWWDLSHGLLGSTVDTGHAWKRVVFVVLHLSGDIVSWLLAVLYWYTRRTTAGVNHRSALLMLVSKTLVVSRIGASKEIDEGFKIFSLTKTCIGQVPLLFQVWLVMPITVGDAWTIHWRRWTHRERATMRLQLSWLYTLGLFFASIGLFWICQGPEASWLVKPEQTREQRTTDTDWLQFISIPALITSALLQMFTNARARSFAGAYSLQAYMVLASRTFHMLYNSTHFMGAYYARPGYHVVDFVLVVGALGAAYQAATLPRVEQNLPEEDE